MTKGVLEQMLDLKNAEFAINHNQTPQSVEGKKAYDNFQQKIKKGVYNA